MATSAERVRGIWVLLVAELSVVAPDDREQILTTMRYYTELRAEQHSLMRADGRQFCIDEAEAAFLSAHETPERKLMRRLGQ